MRRRLETGVQAFSAAFFPSCNLSLRGRFPTALLGEIFISDFIIYSQISMQRSMIARISRDPMRGDFERASIGAAGQPRKLLGKAPVKQWMSSLSTSEVVCATGYPECKSHECTLAPKAHRVVSEVFRQIGRALVSSAATSPGRLVFLAPRQLLGNVLPLSSDRRHHRRRRRLLLEAGDNNGTVTATAFRPDSGGKRAHTNTARNLAKLATNLAD